MLTIHNEAANALLILTTSSYFLFFSSIYYLFRDYIGRIYDNIRATPIELAVESNEAGGKTDRDDREAGAPDLNATEEKLFAKDITKRLRDSEDLLRSLSPFTYRFQITGVDINISLDLVSFMYETVWFHFHAITEALLSSLNSDIYVTFAAVDILCYSLNSSIFLNLRTEKAAFAGQLYKFQKMCLEADSSLICKLSDESWFQRVTDAIPETAMECIADIHHLSVLLKDGIQESANYEVTRSVAARIEKKARVLELNTFFVREGDLSKKSRTGRLVAYKFFLFSDHLIYSHQSCLGIGKCVRTFICVFTTHIGVFLLPTFPPSPTSLTDVLPDLFDDMIFFVTSLIAGAEFKVHEQLALAHMTISDIDDPTGCSFFIAHPTKSFVIVAESREIKTLWLRDTFQTIVSCRKREALRANGLRKMSIIDRIEGQQKSALSQAPRESEVVPKIHPHPIPCLSNPRQPSLTAYASPSSKNLAANDISSVFPPALASISFEPSSAFSPPMKSPPKRNTPPRLDTSNNEREADLDRTPSPMHGTSDSSEVTDVFGAIMQMATLHMDEVELLSTAGGVSPESTSGVNTPEKRRDSSTENEKGLPDMTNVVKQLEGNVTTRKRAVPPVQNDNVLNPIRAESPFQRRAHQRDIGTRDLKVVIEVEEQQTVSHTIQPPGSPTLLSAAEEKSAFQRKAARTFEARIADLPEKSLLGLFNAVSTALDQCSHYKNNLE